MIQLTTPSAGYGNVKDLKSLREQRAVKEAVQQKYDDAKTIVDRVEARIEDVASLGKTKHNQSLDPQQVILDQYRSGLKLAASTAGNIFVNLVSFTFAGTEVPKGTEAVLNRDANGQVTSFEALDKSRGKRYDYEIGYSKQPQEDGSTLYNIVEREQLDKKPGQPLIKSTTVKMDANGTLFIDESVTGQ